MSSEKPPQVVVKNKYRDPQSNNMQRVRKTVEQPP